MEPEAPLPGRITNGIYHPALETREVLWEAPGGGRWFARLWDTWKFSIAQPSFFFAALKSEGGTGRALLFALVFVTVGESAAIVNGGFGEAFLLEYVRGFLTPQEFELVRGSTGGVMAGQVLLLPVYVVSALSVVLAHVLAYLLATWLLAAPGRFETVFKVVCYAQATHLFSVVPVVGCACVQPFYYLLMVFLGLRYAAGQTTGQALFAVFFPFFLILFLVGGGLFDWLLVEVGLSLALPGS